MSDAQRTEQTEVSINSILRSRFANNLRLIVVSRDLSFVRRTGRSMKFYEISFIIKYIVYISNFTIFDLSSRVPFILRFEFERFKEDTFDPKIKIFIQLYLNRIFEFIRFRIFYRSSPQFLHNYTQMYTYIYIRVTFPYSANRSIFKF